MVLQGLNPRWPARAAAALLALAAGCTGIAPTAPDDPPPAPREFRAAWVATVANIDWPSRPGLPVAQQKEEIRRIAERAKAAGLNALIVQVRPAADALYPSALEPWSEYLNGEQGRAPEPFYDPLALWIEEAHARGLELHAWFNPYRARHMAAKAALAASHLANTRPTLVKAYGTSLWLDPGEPEAARHTLAVILDVVRRYDIDGVHIDDYFYPYPVAAPAPGAGDLEFPDGPSWQTYLFSGGTLSRDDWRRQNVNAFVERLNDAVHREKPHVRFGVSPFGVGRPDRRPPGIAGFSQYDRLYADVELWLAKGWLDYLVPQLYWPIDQAPQAFGVLLGYWQAQNTAGRHVWPGLFTSRIDDTPRSWAAQEIVDQVALARAKRAGGQVHFSAIALLQNRKGIADRLQAGPYAVPALVPATPWLAKAAPAAPRAALRTRGNGVQIVDIEVPGQETPWLLAAWARYGGAWQFLVYPASTELRVPARSGGAALEALVLSAVGRTGLESARVSVPVPANGAS